MVQPGRFLRWALYGLGAAVAFVVLVRVGVGAYLGTDAGRALVARKISAQIGMPVEVTAVRLGLFSSSIGLKVSDPAAPAASKAEVFAVENARADVSLLGLATSNIAPKRVELKNVTLTLHVGADGKVITTLPKFPEGGGGGAPTPTIDLTGGRLTIRQDGRPEFALEGLTATVAQQGDRVAVTGALDDPQWGKWTIGGSAAKSGSDGEVKLETDDGPLTMDRLESVPFIPASVWKNVRTDGRGGIAVRLWTGAGPDVHYSLDVRPHGAALTLPEAKATVEKVTGLISVTGSKVTLVGVKGELAGGTLAGDGDADFGPEPTLIHLKVAAADLDAMRLPAEWGLQKAFASGKLKGTADVTLKVYADGRIEPSGTGDGLITEVQVQLAKGTIPAADIPIHLRAEDNRLRLRERPAGSGARPLSTPVRTAARQDKKPADPPPAKAEPKKAGSAPTLDATIRFRDIDIAELLNKLDVKVNYKVGGRVTAEATIAVGVTDAASGSAYRFAGKVSSPALTLEGLTIRDLSANMLYENGKFTLSELVGKISPPGGEKDADGSFRGTVSAAITPPGEVAAALTIDRIPIGEILKALPDVKLAGAGVASGKVTMTAPYASLSDPATWGGSGEVTSDQFVLEGRTAKDIRLTASVAKGVVTVKEAKLTLEGIPVTAEATVGLTGKYAFTAAVKTAGTSVADVRKLLPELQLSAPVEGAFDTDTKISGTGAPLTYTATGRVTASKLTLAKSAANHIALNWELTPEKLTVSDLKADVFGGSLSGTANVPLVPDKGGAFAVEFKDLDAGAATELVPDFTVRVAGKVSGKVNGTIPPSKDGQGRVGNIDLDLSAPKLTVQGIPAERLTGKAALKGGAVEYELEGKTLGGSFEVKGRYPGAQKEKEKQPAGKADRGRVRLTGIDLSRLAGELKFDALRPLSGRFDLSFDFDNDFAAGSGRITFTRLEWGGAVVSQELIGVLVLRDGIVQLTEVRGRVAGGDLRARGLVRVNQPQRNYFTIALTGADAKKLLAPLGADSDLIDGLVSVTLSARLGTEIRGQGTVALPRGTVSGAQVTDLRVPFTFNSAAGGYGHLAVREASVQAGSGRARADLTFDWGSETRLDGQAQFFDVPLRTVAPALGENALLGNGHITGRFDFAGSRVRSIADVTGALIARLSNTSVQEVPLLRQVTPFLSTTGLTKPFQSGDIRGSLRGGVFRVERLALANPSAQLFAEGTVNTDGRVDLNVVAHTGNVGPESAGLRLFGLRVPAIGPVPIGLIRDVSDFLSNRTIRLTVNGTTSNPVVKVNVGALLTDQAVRFFLSRYIPGNSAGALGIGTGFGSIGR